jgi:hypothetical protein
MVVTKSFRGAGWVQEAVCLAVAALAGACSLQMPEKLVITGSPTYTASGDMPDDPRGIGDLFGAADLADALGGGGSGVKVFDYKKTGSPLQTYLIYYPLDSSVDEDKELPSPQSQTVTIEIPDVELQPVALGPLNVPGPILEAMRTVPAIGPSITNPVSIGECQTFLDYMELNPGLWSTPGLSEYEHEWKIPIDSPLAAALAVAGAGATVEFVSAVIGHGSLLLGFDGVDDKTDPIFDYSDLSVHLTREITPGITAADPDFDTDTMPIPLDGVIIDETLGIAMSGDIIINVDAFRAIPPGQVTDKPLKIGVTPDIDSLSEVRVKYNDDLPDMDVTESLGDLSKTEYIALKEVGLTLTLEAFVDTQAGDIPAAISGITVTVDAPFFHIDNIAKNFTPADQVLEFLGEKELLTDHPDAPNMVRLVPDPTGDTPVDITVNADLTDNATRELVITGHIPVDGGSHQLVINLTPALSIHWGGARIKGYFEVEDVAGFTSDLKDLDVSRIGIDGLGARLYMDGSNLAVDDGGAQKDLLSGAKIDLQARYTVGAAAQPVLVEIVSDGEFAPGASSFSFGNFLAENPVIEEKGLYDEDDSSVPPLPVPRFQRTLPPQAGLPG